MPSSHSITCRLRRSKAAVLLCSSLIALTAPDAARAGTYKLYSCNVPGHATPIPTAGPWTWQLDSANTAAFDNCAAGGTFGIRLNPSQRFMRQSTSASLQLRRPAEGPFSRIGIVQYRTWLVAQLSGSGAPAFISDGGAFGPPGGANVDTAPWVSPLFPQANPAVAVQLFCSAGAPADCYFASETPLQARGIEVDLYEETPPSGTIDGGSIIDLPLGDKATLSYSASDQESGVARVEALIGDTVVGRHDLEADPASCPHTGFNACRGTRNSDMELDTTGTPVNEHNILRLRVTDAAGNRTVVTGPALKEDGQPASGEVRLAAHFAGSKRRTRTSRFGQKTIVEGSLTDRQGHGIGDAEILASERIALPGAHDARPRRILTRANGAIHYLVSRRASSRTITLRYEGRRAGRLVGATQSLQLRVRPAVQFKVSLRNTLVRYHGRVTAAPLPRKGKTVDIQGRVKGGVWQTFAQKRSARSGKFAGMYRLRVHRPGRRLEFRVRVPLQKYYPFAVGVGKVVARTVR